MNLIRLAFGSFLLLALFASAVSAQQPVRTFVSSTGSDTNSCSRSAPCRTFQAAVNAAAAGGEVVALDSAGFGSNLTINKSILIVAAPGAYAALTVFSADGIAISVKATDTVILRGLTVNNQGSTGSGIVFAGGTLHIESCVVNGFSGTIAKGLRFQGPGTLEVKDSIFSGNSTGIDTFSFSGKVSASIDQVRLEGNGTGLVAEDLTQVTVRNSIASANQVGFVALSGGQPAELTVENCIASSNSVAGISTGLSTGSATVRVSNSTITYNGSGLVNLSSSSFLLSRGNNTVEGNSTNLAGTIGSYGPQ